MNTLNRFLYLFTTYYHYLYEIKFEYQQSLE